MDSLNNMKEVLVICEGTTEIEFCKRILQPYFESIGINLNFTLILHSDGGIVPWRILKEQIETHFEDNNDVTITTFIDYYGIYDHHKFEDWDLAHEETDKRLRMKILEDGMKNDLDEQIKFIPFILLHEFETLAFCDHEVFDNIYESNEARIPKLLEICTNYPNPEEINNGLTTAPSKRLEKYIRRYKKTSDSINIVTEIGLRKLRAKCQGFHEWLVKIENI